MPAPVLFHQAAFQNFSVCLFNHGWTLINTDFQFPTAVPCPPVSAFQVFSVSAFSRLPGWGYGRSIAPITPHREDVSANDDVLNKKPEPVEMVWAFDLGKGSIGDVTSPCWTKRTQN